MNTCLSTMSNGPDRRCGDRYERPETQNDPSLGTRRTTVQIDHWYAKSESNCTNSKERGGEVRSGLAFGMIGLHRQARVFGL